MMNPMCQADFYGSNFHAAHAAAVATGHSWPYAYPQQYAFGAHPYPGTMVADMTGLTGLPFFLAMFAALIAVRYYGAWLPLIEHIFSQQSSTVMSPFVICWKVNSSSACFLLTAFPLCHFCYTLIFQHALITLGNYGIHS